MQKKNLDGALVYFSLKKKANNIFFNQLSLNKFLSKDNNTRNDNKNNWDNIKNIVETY